jgi:hypothetical protein
MSNEHSDPREGEGRRHSSTVRHPVGRPGDAAQGNDPHDEDDEDVDDDVEADADDDDDLEDDEDDE